MHTKQEITFNKVEERAKNNQLVCVPLVELVKAKVQTDETQQAG